jgi:hypothetical protein
MSHRECARQLIECYVLRGDTVEQLADGCLGSYDGAYAAHIGGWLRKREDIGNPDVKPIKLGRFEIGVEIVGQGLQRFSLKELYKEIVQEKNGRKGQLSLFQEGNL